MGPVKQTIVIPFAGGLDTKTDPKLVQPGKLLQAQNVVLKKTGAVHRRWGYNALGHAILPTGTGVLLGGTGLINFGAELLAADSTQLCGYNAQANAWVSRGSAYNCTVSNKSIQRTTGQQVSVDCASFGGIDVYAWEDQTNTGGVIAANGVHYSVFDTTTGEALLINAAAPGSGIPANDIRPKVIPFPAIGKVILFWVEPATPQIRVIAIDPGNPTATISTSSVIATIHTNFYDAAISSDGSQLVLFASGAANAPTYGQITTALTLGTTGTVGGGAATSSTNGCLNIVFEPTGQAFWVTYADNGAASTSASITRFASVGGVQSFAAMRCIAAASALVSLASIVFSSSNPTWGGFAATYAEAANADTGIAGNRVGNNLILGQLTSPAGALQLATNNTILRGHGLASKPFQNNGVLFINVAFSSTLQSSYFTIATNNNNPTGTLASQGMGALSVVAKSLSGTGGGYIAASDLTLPECQQIRPGVFRYASLIKGSATSTVNGILSLLGVNACTLDLVTPNAQGVTIAGGLYLSGGIVRSYDGVQLTEQNFHEYPEAIGLAVGGADGSLGVGLYNYCVIYAWQETTGLVQYSAASVAASINVAASQHVVLTIPTLRLTGKTNVQILIYRTQVNGTVLTLATNPLIPIFNNTTVDTISYTDKASDASIAVQGAMYTQPLTPAGSGTLPILNNSAPPPCTMMATFDERLFVSGLDNPNQYWFSEQVVQGIPIQFSPFLAGLIDPDGGPITAMVRMDDKLVFFKQSAIFFIAGTGPDATGSGAGFTQPNAIPSGGVGCVSAASIVTVPAGIMFQTLGGKIYLLDRGLNVSYKGAPVEALSGSRVMSATLIPDQWVVFTLSNGAAIVYDYFYDQWSTFTNHAAIAATLLGGLYYWLRADGAVFQQTPMLYSDAGSPIPWSLMTAKIAMGQVQGFQRIYEAFILGSYRGAGITLNVGAAFDYDTAINALAAIPIDSALALSGALASGLFGTESWLGAADGSTVFQFRCDLLRKCQSVQFVISDSQGLAGVEGFSLSAITLRVGIKPKAAVPANKQFGMS